MSLGREPDEVGLPSADLINAIMERARRLARLALGPGIRLEHTSAGRHLSLDRPDTRFLARLVPSESSLALQDGTSQFLLQDGVTGLGLQSSGLSASPGTPISFRRVRLQPDGTPADLVDRNDPGVAYPANPIPVPFPRIVLLRDVGLAGEYRFFTPRNSGVPGVCDEVIIRVTVSGCNGCTLSGAGVTLLKDGVVIGDAVETGIDGRAEWTSLDHSEIVVFSAYSIQVTAPELYQDLTLTVDEDLACTKEISAVLTPIPTHHCTPCCTIPLPLQLGDLISTSPGSWGLYTSIFPAEVCGPSAEIIWTALLACDAQGSYIAVTVDYCCTRENGPVWVEPVYRHDVVGIAFLDFSCTSPINFSVTWPDDFILIGLPPNDVCVPRIEIGTLLINDTTGATLPAVFPTAHTTGTLCVVASGLPCVYPGAGTPRSGVSIEIRDPDDVLVGSGTTGGSGQVCVLDLNRGTTYTITGTLGTCTVTTTRTMPRICGLNVPETVYLLLCCTRASFHVVDSNDLSVDLEDATITLPDGSVLITDSAGLAGPIDITTSQMFSLAPAGEDCDSRLLPVRVSRAAIPPYMESCVSLTIHCSDDGTSPHTIALVKNPPHAIYWPTCCPTGGCTVGGPAGRGFMWTLIDFTLIVLATRDVGGVTLNWTYLIEGQAAMVADGSGNPSLGELAGVVYRSGCLAGNFITPAAEGCGEGGEETQPYISSRFEMEMCTGTFPRLRVSFHQRPLCDNTGQDSGETPGCFRDVLVDVDVPTDVLSACVGTSLFQEWTRPITSGSIDYSLSWTGVST